jgi:DNA-directed RNA polymerase specialized sigma24 family protein
MAKNYINNNDFEIWVSGYNASGFYEIELWTSFDLLFKNIFSSYRFNVEEDDAKQECMLLLLRTVRNFTPDKGRAFNYFTTVILNNLRLLYTKNQKHYNRLEELILESNQDD